MPPNNLEHNWEVVKRIAARQAEFRLQGPQEAFPVPTLMNGVTAGDHFGWRCKRQERGGVRFDFHSLHGLAEGFSALSIQDVSEYAERTAQQDSGQAFRRRGRPIAIQDRDDCLAQPADRQFPPGKVVANEMRQFMAHREPPLVFTFRSFDKNDRSAPVRNETASDVPVVA